MKTSFRTATKTGEALAKVKQSIREITKDFIGDLRGTTRSAERFSFGELRQKVRSQMEIYLVSFRLKC